MFPDPVFPTPVGVFLQAITSALEEPSLPHARGGVSTDPKWVSLIMLSSPRPWGCFHLQGLKIEGVSVFPTPVGVFPLMSIRRCSQICLPHARGGVSVKTGSGSAAQGSSPRPWGCFRIKKPRQMIPGVFPTPVGVFLFPYGRGCGWESLPHARGGVSRLSVKFSESTVSSPRPWGCFCWRCYNAMVSIVFPTPVGVFLILAAVTSAFLGLPHARGGVS